MGVAVAGLVISAGAAIYGGIQAKRTADFNEKVAANEAQYQRQKAELESQKRFEKLQKVMAQGRVNTAKAGVSLMSTTAQEVFDENLEEGLLDVALIRYGGEMRASSAESQGELARQRGNAGLVRGVGQAGSTILTGSQYL